jgi:hypothetical protein
VGWLLEGALRRLGIHDESDLISVDIDAGGVAAAVVLAELKFA